MSELTETHLRYLSAIYDLSQQMLDVSAAEVARAVNVSRPSVTRMLNVLMERGLLVRERYGKIYLTDRGVLLARDFNKKTALIQSRLPDLNLNLTQEEALRTASLLAFNLPAHCWEELL